VRFEFEYGTILFCLSFTFVLFRESRLVVSWRAATRTVAGVGDLVQRTRDGHIGRVLDGRVVERSGGTVCGLHLARGD
jgi:hypothetical protein